MEEVNKEETPKVENNVREEKKAEFKKVEENKKTEKKQDNSKGAKAAETKKSNKTALWIIIGIIVVVAIAAIVGVAAILSNKSTPTGTLEQILTALKTNDYSKVENYKELIGSSGVLEDSELDQEAQKLLFEKLEWNIKEENVDGDTATIELEITNKDFKTVIKNYMQTVLKIAFSGQEINEEQMTNYLLDELKNEEVGLVTENQTIVMKKVDEKWEIEDLEEFMNALMPGLSDAMESIM